MALFMEGSDPLTEAEKSDLVGIEAIKEAAALELKEQGNKYVKMGKKHFSEAIDCYTRAINQKGLGDSDNSVLFANRSHVNLLLGNYQRALTDAKEAIRLCPTNVKAIYRAAKAAFHLDLLMEAEEFCKNGLDQSPLNDELKKLDQQVNSRRKENENRIAEVSDAVSSAKCTISAICNRGLRFGKAMYQELTGLKRATLDENNILHWPVLLLYAEVMASDFIEDFCEIDMFADHLDMYTENCDPLQWDKECNYTREQVELYYQASYGIPLSRKEVLKHFLEGTAGSNVESIYDDEDLPSVSGNDISLKSSHKWIKVNEKKRLCDILQQKDYIIPGIPAFYVVSKSSTFYKEFKTGNWTPP